MIVDLIPSLGDVKKKLFHFDGVSGFFRALGSATGFVGCSGMVHA